jgi:hypothetical protein
VIPLGNLVDRRFSTSNGRRNISAAQALSQHLLDTSRHNLVNFRLRMRLAEFILALAQRLKEAQGLLERQVHRAARLKSALTFGEVLAGFGEGGGGRIGHANRIWLVVNCRRLQGPRGAAEWSQLRTHAVDHHTFEQFTGQVAHDLFSMIR